jgi:hypothetical protein
MEINSASSPLNLGINQTQGDAFSNINVTGRGDSGGATATSTLGNETITASQTIGGPQLTTNLQDAGNPAQNVAAAGQDQGSEAAETAFASVFFSLLQNILSEAQSNSGA